MKKKWLTKAEEQQILKTYEWYKGEFQPYEGIEHCYEIPGVRKAGQLALIRIERDSLSPNEFILVMHTDGEGKKTFIDTWQKIKAGKLLWKYRNYVDEPISDRAAIEDYKKQIKELEEQVKSLQDELKSQKMNHIVETEPAGQVKHAGRKPDPEKLAENAGKVKTLLERGFKEKEIIKKLKISRASYYRYKKAIGD